MKKRLMEGIVVAVLLFVLYKGSESLVLEDPYDSSQYQAQKAIEYANQYVFGANRDYLYFETNCTNFVSQCLVAGGLESDSTTSTLKQGDFLKLVSTNKKWFCHSYHFSDDQPNEYVVSTAFIRANDFVDYWENARKVRTEYYDLTNENIKEAIKKTHVGDVLVIFTANGSTDYHVALVVEVDSFGIYYNSNTSNRDHYNLKEVSKEDYNRFAILHFV